MEQVSASLAINQATVSLQLEPHPAHNAIKNNCNIKEEYPEQKRKGWANREGIAKYVC
jgi:hypothetical protein